MRRSSPFASFRSTALLFALPAVLGVLAALPGAAAAKTFVIPHIVESKGTIANTQYAFDTIIRMAYGSVPGGPGLGASADLYLYNNDGTLMQSQTLQTVCNPCTFPLGGGNPSVALMRIENQLILAGDFQGSKTGFAVVNVGGSNPEAVGGVGQISNSHTSAFDVSFYYEPLHEVSTGGANHKTFILPHILETNGTISNTQFTFDNTINVTYAAGLGGLAAGPGATLNLYLINSDGAGFWEGAADAYVCAPCQFTLDGANRKENIRLENLINAAGGFNFGSKTGYALLELDGDVDAVSMTSYISNSHTSAFDLSVAITVPEEIVAPTRLAVGPGPSGASAVRLAVAPNPSRGADRQVALSFELAEAGSIELAIYDMSGRRIATPARGTRDAGAHRTTWDGRDENGTAVAPGVYFARRDHPNGSTTSRNVEVNKETGRPGSRAGVGATARCHRGTSPCLLRAFPCLRPRRTQRRCDPGPPRVSASRRRSAVLRGARAGSPQAASRPS